MSVDRRGFLRALVGVAFAAPAVERIIAAGIRADTPPVPPRAPSEPLPKFVTLSFCDHGAAARCNVAYIDSRPFDVEAKMNELFRKAQAERIDREIMADLDEDEDDF